MTYLNENSELRLELLNFVSLLLLGSDQLLNSGLERLDKFVFRGLEVIRTVGMGRVEVILGGRGKVSAQSRET